MIQSYCGVSPELDETCFVADSAVVIGKVKMEENVSVWYGAVLRGDVNKIAIGKNTNIQDNCTVHVDSGGYATHIGENVTIGHGAIVHGATIGDNSLIGMGAIVLDGAVIGDNVIVGAGALVPPGKSIPSNCVVMGTPATVVRALPPESKKERIEHAMGYVELAKTYKDL